MLHAYSGKESLIVYAGDVYAYNNQPVNPHSADRSHS